MDIPTRQVSNVFGDDDLKTHCIFENGVDEELLMDVALNLVDSNVPYSLIGPETPIVGSSYKVVAPVDSYGKFIIFSQDLENEDANEDDDVDDAVDDNEIGPPEHVPPMHGEPVEIGNDAVTEENNAAEENAEGENVEEEENGSDESYEVSDGFEEFMVTKFEFTDQGCEMSMYPIYGSDLAKHVMTFPFVVNYQTTFENVFEEIIAPTMMKLFERESNGDEEEEDDVENDEGEENEEEEDDVENDEGEEDEEEDLDIVNIAVSRAKDILETDS